MATKCHCQATAAGHFDYTLRNCSQREESVETNIITLVPAELAIKGGHWWYKTSNPPPHKE